MCGGGGGDELFYANMDIEIFVVCFSHSVLLFALVAWSADFSETQTSASKPSSKPIVEEDETKNAKGIFYKLVIFRHVS